MSMKQNWVGQLRAVKPWWLVIAGLVIATISGWIWWSQVYQNPSLTFWGMMSNSLKTSAVTRQISQSGQDLSLKQVMIMQYGATNAVLEKTTLKQGSTTIVTEQLGLPDKEFIRYTTIASDQKSPQGKPADFSKVINKWAKTTYSASDSQQPPLFAQSSLGIAGGNLIPIVNLSQRDHDSLMRLMNEGQVFNLNLDKLQRQTVAGRPVYKYNVDIQAVGYAALQKTLARMLGSNMLDKVDPKSYQDQPAVNVELSVDVWSRQLRQVVIKDQGRTETYDSYGIGRKVKQPSVSLSGQQLQELVKGVQ
jgi:hypothetical protein